MFSRNRQRPPTGAQIIQEWKTNALGKIEEARQDITQLIHTNTQHYNEAVRTGRNQLFHTTRHNLFVEEMNTILEFFLEIETDIRTVHDQNGPTRIGQLTTALAGRVNNIIMVQEGHGGVGLNNGTILRNAILKLHQINQFS